MPSSTYVTLTNESYAQPTLPTGVAGDIAMGLHRFATTHTPAGVFVGRVRPVGSGAVLRVTMAAAECLRPNGKSRPRC
jgi:pyruvate dehydrogenase complex dehydrogenase (E1) component